MATVTPLANLTWLTPSTEAQLVEEESHFVFEAEAPQVDNVRRIAQTALPAAVAAGWLLSIGKVQSVASSIFPWMAPLFKTIGSTVLSLLPGAWQPLAVAILPVAAKALLIAGTLYCVARAIQVIAGIFSLPSFWFDASEAGAQALGMQRRAATSGLQVKRVTLRRGGVDFDAYLLFSQRTKNNGRWALHTLGNAMTAEETAADLGAIDLANGYNTIVMNAPGTMRSGGLPSRYQFASGAEAAIQFMERQLRATHIGLHGISIGSGSLAEAITSHDFSSGIRRGVRYSVCSQVGFHSLSAAASGLVSRLAGLAMWLVGMDLDAIPAARKLANLRIPQLIMGNSYRTVDSDGIITREAALNVRMRQLGISRDKQFYEEDHFGHNEWISGWSDERRQAMADHFYLAES